MLRTLLLATAIAALQMIIAQQSLAFEPTYIVDMRGFKVDFSQASNRERRLVFNSLDQQLKIVERANVPPAVMDFFRSIPILVDPVLQTTNGAYLLYEGRWIVRMKPTELPSNRPIVLHELLHAYHHQVLKQPTPQVGRAFQQAQREKIYPESYNSAHFMENGKEFFAVIGSIFLHGKKIDQPPFDCSIPAKSQPEFIAFLTEQFGPHPCR
ncbi:MAG TPA: hypothetical protein VK629_20970 [Steroidobacteraceae bacterium]|nr:hypothetical protein [Steroidobacteraceae bacterium]